MIEYRENRGRSLWERVRRWIDDEPDGAAKIEEHARSLRPSEQFLKTIAQELEASLQRESFAPPGLPVCVPREFVVFLSPADDRNWPGQKRRALVHALNQALAGKVSELAGGAGRGAPAPIVLLRSDGTLGTGRIRVKACWEATGPGTTLVLVHEGADNAGAEDDDPDKTHIYLDDSSPDGDATQVLVNDDPLFQIEVCRENHQEALMPVSQQLIRIGRGARAIPVDLRLKDPNVSRLHATLEMDVGGNYWLTSLGRNGVVVDGREVARNERVPVAPGARIDICSYSLRVKRGDEGLSRAA